MLVLRTRTSTIDEILNIESIISLSAWMNPALICPLFSFTVRIRELCAEARALDVAKRRLENEPTHLHSSTSWDSLRSIRDPFADLSLLSMYFGAIRGPACY